MSQVIAGSVELPPSVQLKSDGGGLEFLQIQSRLAHATIYPQGAHVATFRPITQQEPVLFCSRESFFERGKAIRGGVPVIFPWFGPHSERPSLPSHGLVRTRNWKLESVKESVEGEVSLEWSMQEDEETLKEWAHAFRLRYRITVGDSLSMALQVENPSPHAFRFEEALHTYLKVSDVRSTLVRGFERTEYIDKVDEMARKDETSPRLRLDGETDRIYLNTVSTCYIDDPVFSRTLQVEKTGSQTTVLWNPWIAKAAALPDFGDDEWTGMICIETANAADNALLLAPGERHEMTASVRVLPLDQAAA